MDKSILQQLIDLIKESSPYLWQAAREQVQAQMATDLFLVCSYIFIIVGSIIGIWWLTKKRNIISFDENPLYLVGTILLTILIAICFFATLIDLYDYILVNHAVDYYAFKALADLVKASK